MSFSITPHPARAGDRSGTVYELADASGAVRAEIWPFMGFNCLKWQVRGATGEWADVLYTAPDWDTNPVPTRSGHPVLFPFPNRMAGGQFTFEGKEYQLPRNETSGVHAIHGFTPRNPWRVVGTSTANATSASVTGQFSLATDLPAALDYWPGDIVISLTYTLSLTSLHVGAVVENPGPGPVPFGIGYHPYFCIPTAPGAAADDMVVWCPVSEVWESTAAIPTGKRLPIPAEYDFRTARAVGPLVLDTLFTGLPPAKPDASGLTPIARLGHKTAPGSVVVAADEAFRDVLLFTPTHRHAVAIEPYTCATDAANLDAKGIDAGWRVLPPGGRFAANVEYRWEAGKS
ncbi:aldose 1-epimerase [Fimbriiglobus ruber]|uniref:Putative aldose-1-epimerase n=1 Tax=Fimbriiglobus ruber TaxID=1908690 RepID=A0A225CZU5_9BACT|nr:aldose 1-epimerase [Fimbriiglobus ruber]OWK34851.1 putative aldose-1-epimerase [Fimbriiglobus ruber]